MNTSHSPWDKSREVDLTGSCFAPEKQLTMSLDVIGCGCQKLGCGTDIGPSGARSGMLLRILKCKSSPINKE